jgi:hypothetical protein
MHSPHFGRWLCSSRRWIDRCLYDREATIAEAAEHYAQFCTAELDAVIADDRHHLVFAPPPNSRRFASIGNPAGCTSTPMMGR